jgi:polyisoprenoid-binding protein YceI
MAKTTWVLDPTHSEIQFKVKHLMITTVTGHFSEFEGSVQTINDDFTTAKIIFSADVNSISTNNQQRDAHLKNNDFFDAENYPKLTFNSISLKKLDKETYKLYGSLTIKGNTRPVELDVEFGGLVEDPWGNIRAGFTITGKINRQDFGVNFSAVTETGGLLLSDEVRIIASAQLVKQTVAEAVLA